MKKYLRWMRAVFLWVAEPRLAWLCLGVMALLLGFSSFLPGSFDDRLRYAGLCMQLVGVGTVIYEMSGRGKAFNALPLVKFLKGWLTRFPKLNPVPITLSSSASCQANSSMSGRISQWAPDNINLTVEVRIAALVRNLDTLRSEFSEQRDLSNKSISSLSETMHFERAERISVVRAVNEKLVALGTSSLGIELVGAVWLVFGIIFATVPAEIKGWLF